MYTWELDNTAGELVSTANLLYRRYLKSRVGVQSISTLACPTASGREITGAAGRQPAVHAVVETLALRLVALAR